MALYSVLCVHRQALTDACTVVQVKMDFDKALRG